MHQREPRMRRGTVISPGGDIGKFPSRRYRTKMAPNHWPVRQKPKKAKKRSPKARISIDILVILA